MRSLANAEARNDVAAWTEHQMLTKCALCAPPRAGKEHANQRLAFTRARLRRWLEGERATLWQDVPRYRAKPQTRAMSAQAEQALRQQRCADFCAEGADAKACQALTQAAPMQHSAELTKEMRDKHPLAPRAINLLSFGAANVALTPSIDGVMVSKALGSFGKHAAAGPSGMSPLHVRQALTPANKDIVIQHLTGLTVLLAKGQAHKDVAPWLAWATLHALAKRTALLDQSPSVSSCGGL